MLSNEARLEAVRQTRSMASVSLLTALRELFASNTMMSETRLRDRWLLKMRESSSVYPDGWYMPPPHGIGVLFGTEENYARMNYTSLRTQDSWPRDDVFLDRNSGIIYCYASPVDRQTGMIGDFGITIYFGKNPVIIKHLQDCLQLNRDIFVYAQEGMSFGQLTQFAHDLFAKRGLSNEVTSTTDPAGVNIGHTVPASLEGWNELEMQTVNGSDPNAAAKLISGRRIFLNTLEQHVFEPGTACTLEPRLTVSGEQAIPMCSFHTIMVFSPDGSKKLLTDFSDIFTFTGMNYMTQ